MESVSRTCCCKKCGAVKFRIIPEVGAVNYYCDECGGEINKIEYDEYKTLIPTCLNCNSDVFKVWIEVDKKNGEQIWCTTCEKCNEEASSTLVDSDCNIISKEEREILILKDKINNLEDDLDENEYTIRCLKNEKEDLEYELEVKSKRYNNIKYDLEIANRKIDELEYEINNL